MAEGGAGRADAGHEGEVGGEEEYEGDADSDEVGPAAMEAGKEAQEWVTDGHGEEQDGEERGYLTDDVELAVAEEFADGGGGEPEGCASEQSDSHAGKKEFAEEAGERREIIRDRNECGHVGVEQTCEHSGAEEIKSADHGVLAHSFSGCVAGEEDYVHSLKDEEQELT